MTNKFYSGQNPSSRFWLGAKAKKKLNGNLIFRKAKLWTNVFLADFFLKLKRVKIIEAKTDEEKEMVYKLRYEIYEKSGYVKQKNFPNKKLKDEDEGHSISYLALRKNKPVGTVRLVLGNKKEDFPTFRMWNVDFDKFPFLTSNIGEISKLGIKKSEGKSLIWLGMMKKVLKKSKELDSWYWVFNTNSNVIKPIEKKLNTSVSFLPILKDTPDNLKERVAIKEFLKCFDVFPCFVKVKAIGNF